MDSGNNNNVNHFFPGDDEPFHGNGKGPNKDTNGNYSGGLDLIKWVYDFVIAKEPIAGKFLLFYRKKLDLWVNHKIIYRIFLIPALFIDMIFAFLMQLTIFFLLSVIVLSIARGLGIFDWLPEIINQLFR